MGRRKSPPWSTEEIAVLREFYPEGGINETADMLPERSWQAIYVMASKLGLRSTIVTAAPEPKLSGERLERAIRHREVDGWSFARIGAEFDISESAACNAVLIALCPRKGFTPAARDDKGRLLPEGLERLQLMLRKGAKGMDIQLQLGLSASRIAEERRRYSRSLKDRGKAALPPPGNGVQYSGVKLKRDRKQEVEALLLEGFGSLKICERTGISKTTIQRIRSRLVARLRRRGEVLPGCDRDGVRISAAKVSRHYIPEDARNELRCRLIAREPVIRAANELGIGGCSAYRIRDELAAEFAARGEQLPPPIRLGRSAEARALARKARWLPADQLQRYRNLTHEYGAAEARQIIESDIAEAKAQAKSEAVRPRRRTFEEQLEAVKNGAGLVETFRPSRILPDATLGGVATGML